MNKILVSHNKHYFWVPGQLNIVDQIFEFNAQPQGVFSGKTLEELTAEYPTGRIVTHQEFLNQIAKHLITAPEEIDETHWMDALETLPPVAWINAEESESFQFMEPFAYDFTSIFVRVNKRYFVFRDRFGISHQEAVLRVQPFLV